MRQRIPVLAHWMVALALTVLAAVPASAQTYTHNTTTLAAAQSATATTVSLTAATAASGSSFGAVQVGQFVLVDQELEQISATTATSTIFAVTRRGNATAHASGIVVYIGAAGSFQAAPPPAGACTVASQPKFWIVTGGAGSPGLGGHTIGQVYTCSTGGTWQQGNGPWYGGSLNSGNGATVTLTAAQSGTTHLFDRAAGIVYTLPKPVPGMTFDFVYSVTITSNAATVATDGASTFIQGAAYIIGVSTTNAFNCNGTTHVKVTSNGTTTGGILGGRLHFVAVSGTLWQVDGYLVGSGTGATMCST